MVQLTKEEIKNYIKIHKSVIKDYEKELNKLENTNN